MKFVFQPAEEGAPEGEVGGAERMRKEGVLTNPDVEATFALHINAQTDVGTVTYRSGPLLASVQDYRIVVKGRQAHGSTPWLGTDPIVTASQIVMGLPAPVHVALPGHGQRSCADREGARVAPARGRRGERRESAAHHGAEHFSFFSEEVPGLFYFLGGKPLGVPVEETESHHTPGFLVDEGGLTLGVSSMLALALDYLNGNTPVMQP